jgi:hypothetical protein
MGQRSNFKCSSVMSLVEFIELSGRNVGEGVNDKVTFHLHMPIFLKTPICMRQNIPLLQQTKCSPANNIPTCKITSPVTQFFLCAISWSEKTPISIIPVRLFVCNITTPTGQTVYSEILYWRHIKMFKNIGIC